MTLPERTTRNRAHKTSLPVNSVHLILSQGEKAKFTVEVYPDWAPLGAARVREIIDAGIWKAARFFRVVSGFMVQWGIPGKPSAAAEWRSRAEREPSGWCDDASKTNFCTRTGAKRRSLTTPWPSPMSAAPSRLPLRARTLERHRSPRMALPAPAHGSRRVDGPALAP